MSTIIAKLSKHKGPEKQLLANMFSVIRHLKTSIYYMQLLIKIYT